MANQNTNYFQGGANLMNSLLQRMHQGIQMNIEDRRYKENVAFRNRQYEDSRSLAFSADERANELHDLAVAESEYQAQVRPSASFAAGLQRGALERNAAMEENALEQSDIYTGMLRENQAGTGVGGSVGSYQSDNPAFFISQGGTAGGGGSVRAPSGSGGSPSMFRGSGSRATGPKVSRINPSDRIMELNPDAPHAVEDSQGNLNIERPMSEMRENVTSGNARAEGTKFAKEYVGGRGSGKAEPWIGKRNFAPEAVEEGWYPALREYVTSTNDFDLSNLTAFRKSFAQTAGGKNFDEYKLHLPTEMMQPGPDGKVDPRARGEFIQALTFDDRIASNVEERVNKGVDQGFIFRDNYTVEETRNDLQAVFADITGDQEGIRFEGALDNLQKGRVEQKQGKSLAFTSEQERVDIEILKTIQRHMFNQLEMAKARTTGMTWPKVHELPHEVDATDFGQYGEKGGNLGPQPGDINRVGPLVWKYTGAKEGYRSGATGGGY